MRRLTLCDVCEEDIWHCEATESWYLRVQESAWNDYIDGFDYQDIRINFCYECGKDYRKIKKGGDLVLSDEFLEIESEKEIDGLYLYQSDMYFLERDAINSISIHTNDGRIIQVIGDFKIFEMKLK